MKKIITIFKTIPLVAVVFVMAQGCIPIIPTPIPVPNVSVTGKIKKYRLNMSETGNFKDYVFEFGYDSLGRVDSIHCSIVDLIDSVTLASFTTLVERQTNKVVVKQGLAEEVYFLQPNTNYIDSIYLQGTEGILRTIITRDNVNNINSVSVLNPNPSTNLNYVIDSIIYLNNNIVSFNTTYSNVTTNRSEFKYNLSLVAMQNTNSRKILPVSSKFLLNTDVEFFGISLGNNSKNILSEYRTIYDDPNVPFELAPEYSIYNETQNVVTTTHTWPIFRTVTIENIYN